MFILLTPENDLPGEKEHLTGFCEYGLNHIHVRKPGMNETELELWISQYDEKHLRKMVLHDHIHLAKRYPVKGIHLKESRRKHITDIRAVTEKWQEKGLTVSSSFHSPEALAEDVQALDYAFLSPLFTSLSKKSYKGKMFYLDNMPGKVVGLGGIQKDNIRLARSMGYTGIAVLGAVWLQENKLLTFKEIHQTYRDVFL